MEYTYTLNVVQEAAMQAKAAFAKSTVKELLDVKMLEYIDACARDVGADDLANVTKELADPAKLATAKIALGL